MSARGGVFSIHRGLFEHERFASEPFTEREAWMWMIGEAAYRPHCKRVGALKVELQRGQLAHSLRFMAEKWKWTEPRVRRFLGRLKTGDALIDAASDAGMTVVTIRKYDVYQNRLPDPDAPIDAPIDAKENLLPKEEVGGGGDARARATPLISQTAFETTEAIAAIAGFPTAQDWPPGWCGAPWRVQQMLDGGWQPEIMIETARQVIAKKRDGAPNSISYFEKPFARAHALQSVPLPVVKINTEPEIIHATPRNGRGYGTNGRGKTHAELALEAFERAAAGAARSGG